MACAPRKQVQTFVVGASQDLDNDQIRSDDRSAENAVENGRANVAQRVVMSAVAVEGYHCKPSGFTVEYVMSGPTVTKVISQSVLTDCSWLSGFVVT